MQQPRARRLRALHEAYIAQVNMAVEAGREDLAYELADGYAEEGLRALTLPAE